MPITEQQINIALNSIVDNADVKALNYAVNYAKAGMFMSGRELYAQCLYIIGNISHWRGELATQVRTTIKQYIKENKNKKF